MAETINGIYKAEVMHKDAPWKSLDDVEQATLSQVSRFNNQRLPQPISDMPPAKLEILYYET